jgi:Domain of unknown function (DUF4271)
LQVISDYLADENIFAAIMKYVILIWMVLCGQMALAQTVQDSRRLHPDTATTSLVKPSDLDSSKLGEIIQINIRRDTIVVASNFFEADSFRYTKHPFYSFTHPTRYTVSIRQWQGKETIFYVLMGLLILFALIKNGFYRYIQDLTKIFFRTSVRQRQIREQLLQSQLPSLLLNIFFLLSAGMFLALLLQHFGIGTQYNFWLLFLYCALGLASIYGVKFLMLKFIGWALQVTEAADAYIFIVFATNKIIGIALLPFLVLLAFSFGAVNQIAIMLGITVVVGLFAYRYFLSYVSIHRQVQLNFFHFLIYLFAFEIMPLLLINKLLFTLLT